MNTIRTSHYPRHAKMMAMFDHYGLFVVDEADMELHKNWDGVKTIINNTDWTGAIVDRTYVIPSAIATIRVLSSGVWVTRVALV